MPPLRALILAAVLSLLAAAPAEARTLRGPGGFKVTAPKGYTLASKRGVYRISGHGGSLRFARVAAGGRTPTVAGRQLAQALGGKPKGVHRSGSRYRATVGKRAIDVRKLAHKQLGVRTFSGGNRTRLRRIGNTIRGGTKARQPASIPMKRYTGGGATALVPNLKGWQFNSGSGVIEGIGPQGAFAFGVPFWAGLPNTVAAGDVPVVPYPANAVDGLARVVPAEFQFLREDVSGFTNIRPFPGANLLASPPLNATFASANYTQQLGPGGHAVLFYAYGPVEDTGAYYNYMSYIAVRKGSSSRIGAALMRAWSSWDPSANQAQRVSDTIHTILTTQVAGGGIDPDVFDEAAAKWDAYIRGPVKKDDE